MGSENAHGGAFDILEQYYKDDDEFLNHILWVTDDETWVSFIYVEIKEQSKEWMHTHSASKHKKFQQTLPAYQKADGNCFLKQERHTDSGIHEPKDHKFIAKN
jgi:hypothetical protein